MKRTIVIMVWTFALLHIGACSVEKDTFTSRFYHQMVSKFNPLFNGEQALIKAKESLKNNYEEDFKEILPVFPIGDEKAASAVKPDLEKAIAKGNKVINLHSMKIRNEQKNRYIDDSYLLIGKARYYDRDYMKALETFNYVLQEFNDPETQVEALYWVARCETALENFVTAREHFQEIYRSEDLPRSLRSDVYAAYAQLEIDRGRYLNAYQLLSQALSRTRSKDKEVRYLYISAQLQASLGNGYEASQLFEKVIKKGPAYEFLFQAQLARARSYDVDLQDPEDIFEELRKMLRDEKNYDNRDIIYYVMAEVADNLDDQALVMDYLKKSVEVSTKNVEQKALSYLWLAEIYFEEKTYPMAQAYYDSCFQNLPQDHPRYDRIKALKESLGTLVDNLNIIAEQDSLLKLSGMSEKQRMAVVDKIIEEKREEKRRKEEEEARKAMEELAFNSSGQGGREGPMALAGAGGESKFYFYSTNRRSSGQTAFNQKWGNRKLEDNWRRKDKSSSTNFEPGESTVEEPGEGGEEEGENPDFQPETYLDGIPESEEEIAECHNKIQTALFDNGMLYKEEIKDLRQAANSFEELLERYPNYEDEVRIWYSLYRVYKLNENQIAADKYKKLILDKYPDSQFAYLIRNEGKEKEEKDPTEIEKLYDQAYSHYQSGNYSAASEKARQGFNEHSESEYGPKFALLLAISQGYLGEESEYREGLERVVARFPESEQAAKAQKMLNQLGDKEGGDGQGGSNEQEKSGQKYRTDFSSMHRYVVVFPNKKASANKVSIKLTDFSKKYFPNDPLRAKALMMGRDKQVVSVSGLPNKKRAEQFLQTVVNEKALGTELLSIEYKQFVISNSNFSTFYTTQDEEGYLKFYKEHYSNAEQKE